MQWIYKGSLIPEDFTPQPESYGFIYLVTYTNGQRYVGKKNLWSVTKKHFGKKKLATITDKRLKTYEVVTKCSDWQTYEGSSQRAKKLSLVVHSKEILHICYTKKALTYMEIREQFIRDVLTEDIYINDNINRMFYDNVME